MRTVTMRPQKHKRFRKKLKANAKSDREKSNVGKID
jgi:hypothetical protein